MDSFMKRFNCKNEKIFDFISPIYALSSGFVNIIAYYLGLHSIHNARKIFTFTLLFIFLIIAFHRFLVLFFDKKYFKKILKVSLIPTLFLILLFIGVIKYNFNQQVLIYLSSFILYVLPMFVVALDLVFNEKIEKFIKGYIRIAIILLPAIIIYILRIIFAEDKWSMLYLGDISYLSLAYTFMPIVFALSLNITKYTPKNKNVFILLHIFLFLSTSVISISGTRGAIISLYWFALLFLFLQLIKKEINKKAVIVFLIIVLSATGALFLSPRKVAMEEFVTAIPNGYFDMAFDKVTEGETEQSVEPTQSAESVQSAAPTQSIEPTQPVEPTQSIEPAQMDNALDTESEELTSESIPDGLSRFAYYKNAIIEFLKKPLTGIGPFSYTIKYGVYPHNYLLEILCEYGIIIFLSIILFLAYIFLKLFTLSRFSTNIECIFLFICGFIPKMMLSGSIYTGEILLFAIAYGILHSKHKKLHTNI